MLFNTAWQKKSVEVQPQPDLLSTDSLMAWLEQQPAGEAYAYRDPHRCLLARYFESHGKVGLCIGTYHIHNLNGEWMTPLSPEFYLAVTPAPHTYGAALSRLRAFV